MVMTTNRILVIDHAMASRIHYAVRFEELNKEQQRAVWKNFLKPGNKTKIDKWIKEKTKSDAKDLNGREIRNICIAANTLANAETDKELKPKPLQTIYSSTIQFKKQMYDTHMQRRTKLEAPKGA